MRRITKKRTKNQIIGEKGEEIASAAFPHPWLVRTLSKDFGIDLNVEVFHEVSKKLDPMTTGQHLYAQVKSTDKSTESQYVTLHGRRLIATKVDTPLINTVAAMGPAVPVLLLHVDVNTKVIHWVCLNDYIDKFLRPGNPSYFQKKKITIHISPDNVLDEKAKNFWLIEALSQRAKMYAAFGLLSHMSDVSQERYEEWDRIDMTNVPRGISRKSYENDPGMADLRSLLEEALAMDIWRATAVGQMRWQRLVGLTNLLVTLKKAILALQAGDPNPNEVFELASGYYNDRPLSDFFRSGPQLTPLTNFIHNLNKGFSVLRSVGIGFQSHQRSLGLHVDPLQQFNRGASK